MDITIRLATEDDFAEIARLDGAAFGITYTEQDVDDALRMVELTRFYVATHDEEIIGSAGDLPLSMTVPGGSVDLPGVTWVSVSPVYRRRGVLRRLMERQLRDYADRGERMAILTASQGGIYRRFGYGAATQVRKTSVDRRLARLQPDEPPVAEPVEYATAERARQVLPELHDRWRREVPGAVNRTTSWWDLFFTDRESQRAGMTARQFLLHPDGYVAYRIKPDWVDGRAHHLCVVTDYVWLSATAHRALWHILLGLDLVAAIESRQLAMDDPLPHLLNDPRQVQTTSIKDGVWVRPLDIAATLSARTYPVEVEAVLEVVDPMLGNGRYALRGGPDGADCARTERGADVRLTVDALGSCYLGGQRLGALAAAGRVEVSDPRVLSRMDLAFLSGRAPFHGTDF
ncbi:MAG: hypothetical protein QOD87_1979 [Pseudonocardiales bacterium]|jgi:predicted acetyltransferase|nr:hypothetical protein [Pseudonocardiales bacterium]